MLRVIGGTAKGRKLQGPPERKPVVAASHPRPTGRGRPAPAARARTRTEILAETRPTSDLIRGVIFDMLDAMEADYDRVLDLYAGTGALGIEALSRGEGNANFVERELGAINIIQQNLHTCSFESRATVHRLTTESSITRLASAEPYTLILADPPYYDEGAPAAVEAVAASALAGPETVLVYEHHRKLEPPESLGRLHLHKSRRHGDTVVSIYRGEAFT